MLTFINTILSKCKFKNIFISLLKLFDVQISKGKKIKFEYDLFVKLINYCKIASLNHPEETFRMRFKG
jgi:hypothetical protein